MVRATSYVIMLSFIPRRLACVVLSGLVTKAGYSQGLGFEIENKNESCPSFSVKFISGNCHLLHSRHMILDLG